VANVADRIERAGTTPEQITMLLENNPYPQDVRVRSEAESLAAAGHEVTVIAPRGRGQRRREHVRGVNVIRFRHIDGGGRGALGFVLEYLVAAAALHWGALRMLRRGSTVLHLHNPPDILFPAGWVYRRAGRKVIFDHHDLFPETIEVKFGPGLASRVAAWCQRLTFAVADHVLATNESYAEVARQSGKAEADVTIVRNAPPETWTRRPLRLRHGALQRVRLAYLGAIGSQDGVEGLVPVLAHLRDRPEPIDVHLTVIGEGDARASLERALDEHGLRHQVTFSGWVPADQVPELLEEADVCVDPAPATDVNQRSTMTKIAEYLSLAKPVVAYDLLETRRTADTAAVLVTPGDSHAFAEAIARLAFEPRHRADQARAARMRARQLTWARSERALLDVYRGLRTPEVLTALVRTDMPAGVPPSLSEGFTDSIKIS
jgi:glycosyltransferase involved in cell wall biosynthesis